MSEISITLGDIIDMRPCSERLDVNRDRFAGRSLTAKQARASGASFDDVVWVASAMARRNPDVERRLRLWMADCAARVLHIYERAAPGDDGVRLAIVAARQFARGEIDDAACDVARAAACDAACDVARAAACDAACDVARAAACDAARAAACGAAHAAEEDWQFTRLCEWLSDNEPADWPLDVSAYRMPQTTTEGDQNEQ